MTTDNPYAAPQATLEDIPRPDGSAPDASRLRRLGASLIDGIVVGIFLIPGMFVAGMFGADAEGEWLATAAATLVGFVIYVALHGYFIHRHGQTIGKRILDIRVVGLDGAQASFSTIVFVRYLPSLLLTIVPFVGPLLALVDSLFIFGSQRRCLHDRWARTRVVRTIGA